MSTSASNTEETEQLIIKLLRKLERKGKNIKSLLWKLMDEFEDEPFDEKDDESKSNKNKITLLYNAAYIHVCKVGHGIRGHQAKHLSTEPCIICGHRNSNNIKQNKAQTLKFLNQYNIHQIPFGPLQRQKGEIRTWVTKGRDKLWPLHYAAISGDVAQIKQLCQNKNINVDQKRPDFSDKTPVTYAARYGQLESLIELIKYGANLMQTPDKSNESPYKTAVYHKHKAITVFLQKYIKSLYNFEVNKNTNVECYQCYNYDLNFNKRIIDGTMSKYIYCAKCASENVNKIKKMQANNKIIETRIIKTIKENPSISVDTLCQMKDVKALHSVLKDIIVSGESFAYTLWLLDIDNFKAINTHLTHAIADTKLQALGRVLKKLETITFHQWLNNGYDGINQVWAFRQGGDEFALVVFVNRQKINILQKLYERLKNDINEIKLENMTTMKHLTVSIGVCMGGGATDYEQMMKQADEAAETVKQDGKNGIAICNLRWKTTHKNFNGF